MVDFPALNRKLLAAVRRIADGKSSIRDERLPLRQAILKADYSFLYPEGDDDEELDDSIDDLLSDVRINFSLEFNLFRIFGHRNWISEFAEGALEAFPGRQLITTGISEETAATWSQRWNLERQKLGASTRATVARQDSPKSINNAFALPTDPIWPAFSRFDVPYPPYGFDVNMMIEVVSYEESVEHGIMQANDNFNRPAEPLAKPILFGLDLDLSAYEVELKTLYK